MDETALRKKVVLSYLSGIFGSAIAHSDQRVGFDMRYQCLVLRAWFALGVQTDSEAIAAFLLSNMPVLGLSPQACTDSIRMMSKESIFPMDQPWDTPFGWAFAFWPDEVKLEGRLAAAAVAEALQPQATLQKVIAASLDACPGHGIEGTILHERLEAAVQLAKSSSSIKEFKQGFYKKFLIPTPNSYLEVIPLALACVTLGEGKAYPSIQAALELGRNTASTACLAGQIAGAFAAQDDLPPEMVDQVIQKNPELDIHGTSQLLGDLVIEQYRQGLSTRKSVLELSERRPLYALVAHTTADLLFDKILGTLIGGACGDALGCPVEWMHYKDIAAQWGWVDRFVDYAHQKRRPHRFYEGLTLFAPNAEVDPSPDNPLGAWDLTAGTYSDDMRYRLLLCSAMLEKGNAIGGSEFAAYLMRYRIQATSGQPQNIPSWKGPEHQWAKLLTSKEMLEAMYGKRQPVGYCLTWDGPVGLIYPASEELASRHGYLMATCIAHAFHSDATVDSLVECACAHSYIFGELGREMLNRIQGAVELARKSESVDQFYRDFYDQYLVPQPSWRIYVLEQIPAALALLTLGANDPKQAILSAVNFGRDADTIACMVGELTGALFGASALPEDWITTILAVNPKPSLAEIAFRFRDLALERAVKISRLD